LKKQKRTQKMFISLYM